MKPDIKNEEDIKIFVIEFYKLVMQNDKLNPFFKKTDFEHHLPRMVKFWSFAILEQPGYTTNLFEVHKVLPLKAEHFDQWLHLFNKTIDALFEGENSQKAKQKALIIGIGMRSKICP